MVVRSTPRDVDPSLQWSTFFRGNPKKHLFSALSYGYVSWGLFFKPSPFKRVSRSALAGHTVWAGGCVSLGPQEAGANMALEGFVGRSTGSGKGKESGVVREWPYHDAGLTPVKEGEKEKGLGRASGCLESPERSDGGPRRLLIEGLVLGRNGKVVMSLLWPVISWESRGTTDLRNRGAALEADSKLPNSFSLEGRWRRPATASTAPHRPFPCSPAGALGTLRDLFCFLPLPWPSTAPFFFKPESFLLDSWFLMGRGAPECWDQAVAGPLVSKQEGPEICPSHLPWWFFSIFGVLPLTTLAAQRNWVVVQSSTVMLQPPRVGPRAFESPAPWGHLTLQRCRLEGALPGHLHPVRLGHRTYSFQAPPRPVHLILIKACAERGRVVLQTLGSELLINADSVGSLSSPRAGRD